MCRPVGDDRRIDPRHLDGDSRPLADDRQFNRHAARCRDAFVNTQDALPRPALQPASATTTSEARSPVVPATFTASPLDDVENAFATLCDQYATSVYRCTAAITDYDTESLTVGAEVTVRQDVAIGFQKAVAALFTDIKPLTSRAEIREQSRSQVLDFSVVGSAATQTLLQDMTDSDVERRVLTIVTPPANEPLAAGVELDVAFYDLNDATARMLDELFQRLESSRCEVVVTTPDGAIMARQTIPLSHPLKPTQWNAARYMAPVLPTAAKWNLQKAQLAPGTALSSAHRDKERTNRVITVFPGVYTTVDRPPLSREPTVLTPSVTYHIDVPMDAKWSNQPLTATARILVTGP